MSSGLLRDIRQCVSHDYSTSFEWLCNHASFPMGAVWGTHHIRKRGDDIDNGIAHSIDDLCWLFCCAVLVGGGPIGGSLDVQQVKKGFLPNFPNITHN